MANKASPTNKQLIAALIVPFLGLIVAAVPVENAMPLGQALWFFGTGAVMVIGGGAVGAWFLRKNE